MLLRRDRECIPWFGLTGTYAALLELRGVGLMSCKKYVEMRSEMVEQAGPCIVFRRENAGLAEEYVDDGDWRIHRWRVRRWFGEDTCTGSSYGGFIGEDTEVKELDT